MIRVKLWGSLRRLADDNEIVEVEAENSKQLLDALSEKHPALQAEIDRGVSLAIDGVVFRDTWFTPVPEDNEVVLLPYMESG